jgi:hypothetical protein
MADKPHTAKTPKVTIKIPRPLYHNLQLIWDICPEKRLSHVSSATATDAWLACLGA